MTAGTVQRLLIAAGATVVVAACGGGGSSSSSSSSSSGGGGGVGTAGANIGTAAVKVDANDKLAFAPASSTAHVGDVIQWTNSGTVPHTVTFDQYSSLSDPTLAPGATWEVKFTQPGTYSYKCTIHPGMNGTITVS